MKKTNNNQSKTKRAAAKPQPESPQTRKRLPEHNGEDNALQPAEPPVPGYLTSLSLGDFDPVKIKEMNLKDLEANTAGLIAEVEEALRNLGGWVSYTLARAIKTGFYLLEVKNRLTHGQWEPWLETKFSKSASTARKCMRLAKRAHARDLKPGMSIRQALISMEVVPTPPPLPKTRPTPTTRNVFTIPRLVGLVNSAEECAIGCFERVPVEEFSDPTLKELSAAITSLRAALDAVMDKISRAAEPKSVSGIEIHPAPIRPALHR